ncbi:hypothetical protein KOI35_16305 [Actinoplanes bogorensis]|uniref:ABC transmembrane type-1 domain-containing protein n=1 Tax=Paractinoplanes bogorensis TaxID=1610840 RepID=A0ABS5YNM6_9ACTN|nr:hypothetical protein [Actinoplanes bogorensis]MBU2665066.1 hypothetical protein [Actinoplanes bogorensis]
MEQVERAAPVRRSWWRTKTFAAGAVAVGVIALLAVLGPVVAPDYVSFDIMLIDPERGVPLGDLGGISGDHWFGVEPLMGRDLFARVVHAMQLSLRVALVAAVAEVVLGLLVALVVRRGKVRGQLRPALMWLALLVPVNLLVEVWFAYTGRSLLEPPTPSWGAMLSDATVWFDLDPAFLLIPGLLLVATVFAFLLLGLGMRER